jgi:hypothetical protein
MSNLRNRRLISLAGLLTLSAAASADWILVCPPPPGTNPFSNDYGYQLIRNELFGVCMGISGTYTYGGSTTDPTLCFTANLAGNMRGRIGFGIGPEGSIQSSFDNGMGITWGWSFPNSGVVGRAGYATIQEVNGTTTTSTMFGANAFQTTFTGESDTYFFGRTTNGNVQIDLRADLVGDAARLDWTLRNLSTNALGIGMRFGQHVALQTIQGESVGSVVGNNVGDTYVTAPGIKPPRTERRWTRATDPTGYPAFLDFGFSQSDAYGMRVENEPSDATTDASNPGNSQTPTDQFVLGQGFFLLGTHAAGDINQFPDVIFFEPISDVKAVDSTAFIQTWNPQTVAANSSRKVVAFYRSTWSASQYSKPYSVVVDAPKVLNLDQTDSTQFEQNPFNVQVWVDNNRGFSQIDQELPLQDVRVELLLPDGLTAVGGSVKTIARIEPRRMQAVNFLVQADDFAAGDLAYQVRITPTPGPVKTISGVIKLASQPKMIVRTGANLVTSPWTYESPVWETILGLLPDADYQAFTYDPTQKGYIVSTGPERGKAEWIISKVERGISLGGNPVAPQDWRENEGAGGAPLVVLKPGWNLIGNPFHQAIQLGQIVGSANANPDQSYTFAQLVQQGIISGSLAYWDTAKQNYDFIQRVDDRMEPQRGYWIYVFSAQNVVLRYPGVFEPFSRKTNEGVWQQSDKQWRLQIAARGQATADDQNFIGVASSAQSAISNRVYEPPIAPIEGAISVAVEQSVNGQATRLAQGLSDKPGRQEFKMVVDAKNNGPVTLTWPNLSTIPKNVRAKMIDVATGEVRDLRKVSGYTFQAEAGVTREFKVQVETGATSRAIIGNVVSTRSGRGADASIRLAYTLGADATTTVRIMNGSNREVMTLARGRADKAGQNEVVWNLRDQANRAVPPGGYRVEILAEGTDGERSRKIYPITVVR